MEHHDWEWSEDGGHGDAETADLSGGDDLGHSEGFTDFGDHDGDLGGHDFGGGHDFSGGQDDLGGQHLSADSLDEPLGTENAVGAYDADIADHDAGHGHDDDLGHTADPSSGVPDEPGHLSTDVDGGDHLTGDHLTGDHVYGDHVADRAGEHGSAAGDPDAHDGSGADHSGADHPGADHSGADHTADPADPGPHTDTASGDHGADQGPHADPGADGHGFEVNDGHGDATGDHLVGVDPDLDHRADDPGWHDDPFPPELHLETTPEPVDGFPWVDPATLGGHEVDDYTHVTAGDGGPDVHEFAQYSGIDLPPDGDPWTALFGAEDPATSSLAQWWAPGG